MFRNRNSLQNLFIMCVRFIVIGIINHQNISCSEQNHCSMKYAIYTINVSSQKKNVIEETYDRPKVCSLLPISKIKSAGNNNNLEK